MVLLRDVRLDCQKICCLDEKPWIVSYLPSLKLTFSPMKMDGWKTILSYGVSAYFQGLWPLVSGRVTFF